MQDGASLPSPLLVAMIQACADIMRTAAREIIMPGFGRITTGQVRFKTSERDVVTEIDERAEAYISSALQQLAPEALIVGEESSTGHPERISQLANAPLAFTVDPIDGTINYVEGIPTFGVMVAIVSRGQAVASVILDPVSGRAAMACRGQGAWLCDGRGQQTPLRYARAPESGRNLRGKLSWTAFKHDLTTRAPFITDGFERLWDFRCASMEYLMAACGHAHVLFYRQVMPWDHCPGWILLKESGAYGACLGGAPYRVGAPSCGLLYAPDRAVWSEVDDKLGLTKGFCA